MEVVLVPLTSHGNSDQSLDFAFEPEAHNPDLLPSIPSSSSHPSLDERRPGRLGSLKVGCVFIARYSFDTLADALCISNESTMLSSPNSS